ncbi:MAG: hypothetical protein ABIJ26_04795 [Candidatus Margulisiibacteriota bacterium]
MNQNQPFECLYMGGSEDIVYDVFDDATAAAIKLDGKAFYAKMTGHTFFAGSTMYWTDTDNTSAYKHGMRYVHAVATNYVTLSCDYFQTENIDDECQLWPSIVWPVDWQLKQVELHLEAAGATAAENFVIALDSDKGAYWDTTYYTKDMNGVADIIWIPEGGPITISKDDKLNFTWANADSRNWGLKAWYRRLR